MLKETKEYQHFAQYSDYDVNLKLLNKVNPKEIDVGKENNFSSN